MSIITIEQCQTQHLFLLVGGNTLPNYVAARLLASKDTVLYLVHSEGTRDEREALSKTLNVEAEAYPIIDVPVQATSPTSIFRKMSDQLSKIADGESVGLHYTGGTKAMAVHAYRAIQEWQKEQSARRRACYTYLDARTLHFWAERSDWVGVQALFVGDKLDVSLMQLLSLHRRDQLQKPLRYEAIWHSTVAALFDIYNNEPRRKQWVSPLNTYKQYREVDEHKLKAVLASVKPQELHSDPYFQNGLYACVRSETQVSTNATFGEIITASPFAGMESPYVEAVKWFSGGWFEDYVFGYVESIGVASSFHELALNLKPKIGNKDFEFDVVAMRHYQLFAFSCTLHRDRSTCKHKLLEAVARARQLGGSEARIALVCCIDDALDLEHEVEALVRDNQVKVFGRSDLPKLQTHIEKWLKDLDFIASRP